MSHKDEMMSFPNEEYPFQRLAEGAPLMIWMSGLDMGCFYFNRAWLDFRGRTLEEEQGNGWAEGVHPEDVERCVNHYVLCFQRKMPFAMTYRLRNSDGEYRWILDRGAPHYLPDGTFLGFFGGCAELDEQPPANRLADIRTSLEKIREYAQSLAAEGNFRRNVEGNSSHLQTMARDLQAAHAASSERIKYAELQMAELATDMMTNRSLQRGACIPTIAQ